MNGSHDAVQQNLTFSFHIQLHTNSQ